MSKLNKKQRQLHHTSSSSIEIAEGFPHVKEGNEGDITLRHIRGKGMYMFVKFRNRWYSRQFLSGQGRSTGVKEAQLENPQEGSDLNFNTNDIMSVNCWVNFNSYNASSWTGVVTVSSGNAPASETDVLPVANANGVVQGIVNQGKLYVTEESGEEQVQYNQYEQPTSTNYIYYGQ